jgi:hypothetical protein
MTVFRTDIDGSECGVLIFWLLDGRQYNLLFCRFGNGDSSAGVVEAYVYFGECAYARFKFIPGTLKLLRRPLFFDAFSMFVECILLLKMEISFGLCMQDRLILFLVPEAPWMQD